MRQIGTLPEDRARRFADYLLTLGITTKLDETSDGLRIWVHKEDLVARAKDELQQFEADPENARFTEIGRQAEAIRRREEREERKYAQRTVDLRNRLNRAASFSLGETTRALLILCVVVFVANWLLLLSGGPELYVWLYAPPLDPSAPLGMLVALMTQQPWRLVTPIFVHFGLIHLLFNMYMLSQLGTLVERRGSRRDLLLLVFVGGALSNLAQMCFPELFTLPWARTGPYPAGGMSGVLYAIFGFAWIRGRHDPSSGLALPPNLVTLLLVWLVVCSFNWPVSAANTAHVAGLVVGMAYGFATLRREGER